MSAHTPGPWTAQGAAVVDQRSSMIAEFAQTISRPSADECAANASLAAAAPELLAALELARRWMCEVPVAQRGGNWSVALERVDAAIAKAVRS